MGFEVGEEEEEEGSRSFESQNQTGKLRSSYQHRHISHHRPWVVPQQTKASVYLRVRHSGLPQPMQDLGSTRSRFTNVPRTQPCHGTTTPLADWAGRPRSLHPVIQLLRGLHESRVRGMGLFGWALRDIHEDYCYERCWTRGPSKRMESYACYCW